MSGIGIAGLERVARLADGRRLAWREYGCADGRPVLALHGTPGSRLKFEIADGPARTLRLRLIAPDRWGYGETSPHPAPSLAAFAADMAALAGMVQADRFSVLGVSGGGPYASAVAACLPDRVTALALVAPVGPIAGEAVAMSRFHAFCFGRFARSSWAARRTFQTFSAMLRANPRLGMSIAMARAGPPDRRVLAAGAAGRLASTFMEGLKHGAEGPTIDMSLFAAPWRLPLDAVAAPSRLWLGDQDRHVPLAAAQLLGSRLAGCEVVRMPREGHLWVALNYAVVLRWLAELQPG